MGKKTKEKSSVGSTRNRRFFIRGSNPITNKQNMEKLEEIIKDDLYKFLVSKNMIDRHLPQCPDVEEKWETIAQAYLPDGIREFQKYPVASLGWMMYIGMAIARMWDEDWATYSQHPDLYAYLRDKRDYDHMDEYIREEVLHLQDKESSDLEVLTSECAARVNNTLIHQYIEPGTKEAFYAYVDCLHQLYLMGAAVQLKRMGYHMTKAE